MKRIGLMLGAGCLAAVAAAEARAGVTFDFKAASDRMFGASAGAGNLIRADGWTSVAHVHLPGLEHDRTFKAKVAEHVRLEAKGGEFLIATDERVKELFVRDPNGWVSVSGSFCQEVVLPDAGGGVYHFSLEFQQQRFDGLMGGAFIQPYSSDGSYVRQKPVRYKLTNNAFSEWFPYAGTVVVPSGCDRLSVVMRMYAVGFLRFRGVSLVRDSAATPIVLRQGTHGVADPSFAVASNQCGYVCWEWKKADFAAKYKASHLRFVLDLPPGIEFMEASFANVKSLVRETRPDGSTRITFRPAGRNGVPDVSFNVCPQLAAFVRSSAPVGTEGRGTLRVECDGRLVSNILETRYFVVPEVRARAPKRYRNGVRVGWNDFTEGEAARAYARMAFAAGARWVVPSLRMSYNGPRFSTWRDAGFEVITPQTGDIKNGFYVGKSAGRPAEERFEALDPAFALAAKSVCPVSVYEESPFFRTNTVPWLHRVLAGADGVWANWEPHFYTGRGCFCDRCRDRFADFVGVSREAMKADWPKELAYGRKWYGPACRFRSREHGRLVRTLQKHISAATSGAVGFMPGISWGELCSTAASRGVAPEVKASEYVPALKWIDPWGPYPRWNYGAPYALPDGLNAETFLAARDVREQMARDYPLPNRPKLLAFPQGYQPGGIVQPEWLALSLDAFFFNGWEASAVYHFPCGYDARYWQAFAEATSRAADCEDYVFDGVRADGRVAVEVDPACDLRLENLCSFLPDLKRVSALQTASFDLKGNRLVAVFNFRDRTDMAFVLRQKGLSGRFLLKRDGASVGRHHTAAELAKGIRLTAPAARTTVFEFVRIP